jgi:hypothetical protein
MKLKTLILSLVCFIAFSGSSYAQKFAPAFDGFSKKKTTFITMDNGDEIECTIASFKRKKGLIEEIKIKDLKGKKVKIKPEAIKHMYIPPSGLSKVSNTLDFLGDAQQWEHTDLDSDIIEKGYAYLEKAEVMVKKKKRTLMMQLVNPTFCNKVRVYHDPFARETMSAGIGGVTLVGGLDKSYYVKVGNDSGYRLEKKNYKGEEFNKLFGDCAGVTNEFQEDVNWSDFEAHLFKFTEECGE